MIITPLSITYLSSNLISGRKDRTNIIIVVEPVGLVGNRKNAVIAAAGLKAVGSRAVNSF